MLAAVRVALLSSRSPGVQVYASGALDMLALVIDYEGSAAVAAAGAIRPLIALLFSRVPDVERSTAGALGHLGAEAVCGTAIAAAGAVPPLVALLASPSADIR